jgi:hypothetical protein
MLNQVWRRCYEMAVEVHEHLALHGIKLVLGDGLNAIEKVDGSGALKVLTCNGKEWRLTWLCWQLGCGQHQAGEGKRAGCDAEGAHRDERPHADL